MTLHIDRPLHFLSMMNFHDVSKLHRLRAPSDLTDRLLDSRQWVIDVYVH